MTLRFNKKPKGKRRPEDPEASVAISVLFLIKHVKNKETQEFRISRIKNSIVMFDDYCLRIICDFLQDALHVKI